MEGRWADGGEVKARRKELKRATCEPSWSRDPCFSSLAAAADEVPLLPHPPLPPRGLRRLAHSSLRPPPLPRPHACLRPRLQWAGTTQPLPQPLRGEQVTLALPSHFVVVTLSSRRHSVIVASSFRVSVRYCKGRFTLVAEVAAHDLSPTLYHSRT